MPTGHADDHDIQIRLAMAEASLRASRTFVLDVTEEVFTEARAGNPVAHDLQTAYTLAAQLAVSRALLVRPQKWRGAGEALLRPPVPM